MREILNHMGECMCMLCTDPSLVLPKESVVDQALSQMKAKLLGELPEEVNFNIQSWDFNIQSWDEKNVAYQQGVNLGHNSCLSQVKKIIEEEFK